MCFIIFFIWRCGFEVKKRNPLLYFCTVSDWLVKITSAIGMALQLIFMILLAVQIFMRFCFNSPIYGIEESVTAMVVWFACFGAVAVTNDNGHAQIEFFLRFFPKSWHRWLQVFVNILGVVIGVLMINGGQRQFKVQKLTMPAGGLPFSKAYYYALPIIVMGVLMIIVCISRSLKVTVGAEKEREGGDII